MARYTPFYDPLVNETPGLAVDYAPTYWVDTAGKPPPVDGAIQCDKDVDVAIIGSGFTGLTTAIFLAKNHAIQSCILEANTLAWGCTSRNGGQGQFACGRLTRTQWIARWGKETAQRLHEDVKQGYQQFCHLARNPQNACDAQGDGHIHIAQRASAMKQLQQQCEIDNNVFNYSTRIVDADTLKKEYLHDAEAHGALIEPEGIGIHPLKMAYSYCKTARRLGVTIHPASPVISWTKHNGKHLLQTAGGVVRATKVAVATGGYSSVQLHPSLSYRYMPILSNSVVTRPLSADEINACHLQTKLVITDSRYLRFYYRFLPDNRLQMGTRSAITGKDADNSKHYQLLINGLYRKFPSLRGIQVDYSWWGWVDVSHDMMPRITTLQDDDSVAYALGYGGNGVAFSVHAGLRMAQILAGETMPELPIYCSQLPRHPLTPFRRLGQKIMYTYYNALDMLP